MERPLRILAVAAVVVAVSACDDKTSRPGIETSTVSVRAYVDANGTGVYDSGDVALTGAAITLTHSGGTALTGTTDGAGLVVFDDVPPGSYRAALSGTVPQGAVLATASSPIVAAPAFGAELSTEFRYVFNPGSVSGTLFRDNNADGVFDAGDTPAPGIPVSIYAGTSTSGDPVATGVTDPDGDFEFSALRPGTYTLAFEPFPTMTLVGGNTQTVTVGAEEAASLPVLFTGSLISTIAELRAAAAAGEKSIMAVEGVVTWQPPFSDELFIQDETGGILVFAAAAGVRNLGLERGDRVLVVGETNIRFGELQLTNVSTLTVQSSGVVPEPAATSAVEINAVAQGGENERQHELVTITGATVTDIDLLSFGNQFVTLTDQAGNEFGVYADSRTGVVADMWSVGGVYDVTGVPGYDNRFAYHNRIEVRGPEDVEAGEAPMSVADARNAEAGTVVTVAGIVSWQPISPAGSSFSDELFIQDATAGIQIYGRDADVRSLGLRPGDLVVVTGETEDRFGERQLTRTSSIVKLATQDPPTPVAVSPAQIASGDYIHELVRVEDAVVTEVTLLSFGNQLVTLRAPDGTEFGLYVDSRTGVVESNWTVGSTYTVTGVVNYDSRYGPHPYRIWIRSAADVESGG